MRAVTALLAVIVTGCASSGTTPESGIAKPTERVVASDPQGMIRTSVSENAKSTIDVPPGRVLAVIGAVYTDLGIPSASVDAATGSINAPRFYKNGKLGNTKMSFYFNCGDSLNGTIADAYRMYMTVVSVVRSNGKGGSEIETSVTGEAANMSGSASGRIPCGSTGQLEQRVQMGVREKLGAP